MYFVLEAAVTNERISGLRGFLAKEDDIEAGERSRRPVLALMHMGDSDKRTAPAKALYRLLREGRGPVAQLMGRPPPPGPAFVEDPQVTSQAYVWADRIEAALSHRHLGPRPPPPPSTRHLPGATAGVSMLARSPPCSDAASSSQGSHAHLSCRYRAAKARGPASPPSAWGR